MAAPVTVFRPVLAAIALMLCGLLPAAAAMAAAVPAAQAVPLGPEEQAWRKAHPLLRVGVFAGDHMPIEGWSGGRADGFGPDYARLLAGRAGLRVSFVPFTAWTPVAFKGEEMADDFDMLVGQPILPATSQAFRFLQPFATGRYVMVAKRDHPTVRNERDLGHARVAIERSFVSALREIESRYPGATLLPADDGRQALAMVGRGEADAYIGSTEFRTQYLLRQAGDASLAVVDVVPLPPLKMGVAVNNRDPVLASILRKAEATVTPEELDSLRVRWGIAPNPHHAAVATGLSADERVKLARLPTLRLGFEIDRAPYSFLNAAGQFDGLAADYINYLRDALGFEVELVPARDWKQLQALAQTQQVDMIAAAMPGDVRSGMLFTAPYERFPEVIVARVNGPAIVGPEDLSGRRVAIRDEPILVKNLQAAVPGAILVPVGSNEAGLARVADGQVDAYVGTLPAIDAIVRDRYAGDLRVVGPTGIDREFAIGVAKRHAELVPLLDRVLEQISSHDRMQIRARWIAGNYSYGFPLATVLGIVLAAAVLISILAFAYVRTRREVLARRQAEARLAIVTRTLPLAVFEVRVDPQGRRSFTYVAGDTLGTIGLDAQALLDDAGAVAGRIVAEDAQMLEHHVAAAIDGLKPVPMLEFRVTTALGQRWLRTAGGLPHATAAGVEWSGYWVDVTDSHEHADALGVAISKAEREVQVRSSFLAMLSHEIRTPMSGIVSWLELAADADLPAEQAGILGTVMESSSALLEILDDILDFSRIDSGRLVVRSEEIDLRTVMDGTIATFAARAAAKGVRVYAVADWQVAPRHVGDALRIRQVLSNLLSNAVKFTASGHVEVRMTRIGQDDGVQHISWSVIDTGAGMSAEQMGRLFEPFSQVGAGEQALLGGSGLGLTISKRLARLMGGEVELQSEPGHGTSATLTLALPIAPLGVHAAAFAGRHVAVDVADPLPRAELSHALAFLGFEVAAQAPGEPIDAARRIDLVVSDGDLAEAAARAGGVPVIRVVQDAVARAPAASRGGLLLAVGPLRRDDLANACALALGLAREPAAEPAVPARQARNGARILVVEDHDVNRRIVASQVERLGYDCVAAANGREALALMADAGFDLILTDCHMPGMDGYALTRAIRQGAVPGARDIPVVALSAGVLEEQVQRCRDAGMDDFLAKPILMGPLAEVILRNLRSPAPSSVEALAAPAAPENNDAPALLGYLGSSAEAREILVELLHATRQDLALHDAAVAAGQPRVARELLHKMRGALLLLGVAPAADSPAGITGRGEVERAIAHLAQRIGD